jgi:hypothetical protein
VHDGDGVGIGGVTVAYVDDLPMISRIRAPSAGHAIRSLHVRQSLRRRDQHDQR